MRKKELKQLNDELIAKVEKQNALIEKLQLDLSSGKTNTKTIYIETPSVSKKNSILDNYGTTSLLKNSMTLNGKTIFSLYENKKVLDMISFEEWFVKLKRDDIIGNLKHSNSEVYEYLDQLDLATIKTFFKTPLKEFYEKERKDFIDLINKMVYDHTRKRDLSK